jgi:hypothetical protein
VDVDIVRRRILSLVVNAGVEMLVPPTSTFTRSPSEPRFATSNGFPARSAPDR